MLQAATLILALVLLYRPLGDYMARVYTGVKNLRVERGIYRLIGVDVSPQALLRRITALAPAPLGYGPAAP